MSPLELLRHHVTGAVERGETQAIKRIPVKYSVNRWNDHLGADIENLCFSTKAKAIKWARGTNHAIVRLLNNDRTVIFSR